jgi:hypothetical protein
LQQNKAKLGSSVDEVRAMHAASKSNVILSVYGGLFYVQVLKDEKAFTKRGSILGAFTASISEALSSSMASQSNSAAPSAASDTSDSIFMALKRKGSALSDAIFNPSEGSGSFKHHSSRRVSSSSNLKRRRKGCRCIL